MIKDIVEKHYSFDTYNVSWEYIPIKKQRRVSWKEASISIGKRSKQSFSHVPGATARITVLSLRRYFSSKALTVSMTV